MLPDDDAAIVVKPARLFRLDIIATVLDLIAAAWGSVCTHPDINASTDEDTISGALYGELHKERQKRGIDGPPSIKNEVATRKSQNSLLPDGFIDFQFIYHWEDQDYFGMECKRVSSTDPGLAKKYVEEGMMRFVSGKYSTGHEIAAMLGFVIDSNMVGSVNLIRKHILSRQAATKMVGQWNTNNAFGSHSHLYETQHRQQGQQFNMTLLHLFQEL